MSVFKSGAELNRGDIVVDNEGLIRTVQQRNEDGIHWALGAYQDAGEQDDRRALDFVDWESAKGSFFLLYEAP